MKTIIKENQRGILIKNGKFIKVLEAGVYRLFTTNQEIQIFDISQPLLLDAATLRAYNQNTQFSKAVTLVHVSDERIVLYFQANKLIRALTSGTYAFFKQVEEQVFQEVSIRTSKVDNTIPTYIFKWMDSNLYTKVIVTSHQKARVYIDGKFDELLDEGTYYYWNNGQDIHVEWVDTRRMQMDITGQEILTLDKVALRINFVCQYKIKDYLKIASEIEDYVSMMHVTLQLALREYVGKYRLDEILENKEQISRFAYDKLQARQDEFYIEVYEAGVKDIILPGEIREIMNTVLIAEKKAQANVISRREEVASTRSLLNTAKLMDENSTLYKLKELEYLEKISSNVGSIQVGGNDALLDQLLKVMKG